jgi:cytosine/adenosine deaminase-related metal-dependent hydrolase
MTSIYSARWVLPIASPAIDHGAVAVEGPAIVAVGQSKDITSRFPAAHTVDFGNSVILPGLVNAHSHLELTVMRGFLEREEHDFFAWLRKLTLARLTMTSDDLFVSAMCGAIDAARAGVTCLGDSSSVASESMKALRELGLRGVVYQESFGPDPTLAHDNVSRLSVQLADARTLETNLVRAGVSPHAPYTVSPPQLELIARMALEEKFPLMMHAAESESERSFMLEGSGAFADSLRARNINWQAPGISTIQHLDQHGVLETKPLLAHCITLDDGDIELIQDRRASIAHCPRSNAKLGHGRAPFAKFLAADLKVGIGSDSVASNNNCDILEEARFATLLARTGRSTSPRASKGSFPTRDSETIGVLLAGQASATISATQSLFAATLGGARALGLDRQIGALVEGMQADLIVVQLDGAHQQPAHDPVQTLIFSSSGCDVRLTMVAGQEIYRDGSLTVADQSQLLKRLNTVRTKIDSVA